MPSEGPVSQDLLQLLLGEADAQAPGTAKRGRALLLTLDNAVERAVAELNFVPDGPIADRHGSLERQFLRNRDDGATDVLTVTFEADPQGGLSAAITPAVVRENDYAVGESTRVENVRPAANLHERPNVAVSAFAPGSRLAATARAISGRAALWQALGSKVARASSRPASRGVLEL